MTAHWGVPDPVAVDGAEDEKLAAFHDAAILLKRRIELFLSPPIRKLDALSLRKELQEIGRSGLEQNA